MQLTVQLSNEQQNRSNKAIASARFQHKFLYMRYSDGNFIIKFRKILFQFHSVIILIKTEVFINFNNAVELFLLYKLPQIRKTALN